MYSGKCTEFRGKRLKSAYLSSSCFKLSPKSSYPEKIDELEIDYYFTVTESKILKPSETLIMILVSWAHFTETLRLECSL